MTPALEEHPGMVQTIKHFCVAAFFAKLAIQFLNEAVLHRLAECENQLTSLDLSVRMRRRRVAL